MPEEGWGRQKVRDGPAAESLSDSCQILISLSEWTLTFVLSTNRNYFQAPFYYLHGSEIFYSVRSSHPHVYKCLIHWQKIFPGHIQLFIYSGIFYLLNKIIFKLCSAIYWLQLVNKVFQRMWIAKFGLKIISISVWGINEPVNNWIWLEDNFD